MMRRVGWIRLLSLLCAGVCAAPVMVGQTATKTNNKGASTAGTVYKQQPTAAAQKPAAAAATPKAAQTATQKQPAKAVQSQPAASTSPQGSMNTNPLTSVQPKKGSATT